ncbi:WD repeat-containing protein 76-like isoform X2 [Ruditapes philippinarum]|uniref:WD repeat-containing protein 76-like isoform X2 n=1 Tax=Ruditapes philippinarum TaxID=129788 RepID=UPI00295B7D9F|nr:WD repeat-containing protein 76-like isoform X2 [Ruditapes philippinarum]
MEWTNKFVLLTLVSESPKQKKKMKVEKVEEEEDGSADSDLSDYEIDYAKRREENLRLNREFLSQFGLDKAKQDLLASVKKTAPSNRGLKKEKAPKEILPRRSSLRLQNKTPDGIELPPEALINRVAYTFSEPVQHLRPPAGPLEMKEYLHGSTTEENHKETCRVLTSLKMKPFKTASDDLERYAEKMSKTKVTAERVAKVVPERTFSLALHPSDTKVIAAVGDKWGKIGIWDVLCNTESRAEGVCCYAPHSRPITCLDFPVHSPEKMYSCGYDGSLRCGDMQKEIFIDVFNEPEDDDVLLRNFVFTSPHTMLVSENTGCVACVDIRTASTTAEQMYELSHKSFRTVSCHPTQPYYFCTAGVAGSVSVWDQRNLKPKKSKALCELAIGRNINSAYFSPVTGKHILATSINDKLTIYDSSEIGPNVTVKKSISHNNQTGRWLTGFRAAWHPAREDCFIVGSMNRPREISLFSVAGKKLHAFRDEDYLNSVCSLNALHPTLNLVAGTNSSGRVFVFM